MAKDSFVEIDQDVFREHLLKFTRKAFQLLPNLEKPRILDIGCGSGVPTIELAKLSNGEIVGVDTNQSLLDKLNRKIKEIGLLKRISTRKFSMFESVVTFRGEPIRYEGDRVYIGDITGIMRYNRPEDYARESTSAKKEDGQLSLA